MMNTICQLSKYAFQELKDSYNKYEISALCNIIYTDVLQFTNIDIHLRKNEILQKSFTNKFYEIIQLLKKGHPIQYILGETQFAGLKFFVTPSTLIPRPETVELTDWIKTEIRPRQRLLDIGTGSGCIAITLAKHCPEAEITGTDISGDALCIARRNADLHQVKVNFLVRDILAYEIYPWETFDIIVSNPPYVRESEKRVMAACVLCHEPARALFVPDNDPLLFYRKIAVFGQQHLQPQGSLYFEINEAFGTETIALLKRYNYQNIELRKDIFGKERMIKANLT